MKISYIPHVDSSDDTQERNWFRLETFAKRLEFALNFRGMKQVDLCAITDIPEIDMIQYLNGGYVPKRKELKRIAMALNVNEPWLMGWTVPLTKYDGTPEMIVKEKPLGDKDQYSKTIDLLYSQMKIISEASQADEPEELSALSNSMASIAEIILKYIQQ